MGCLGSRPLLAIAADTGEFHVVAEDEIRRRGGCLGHQFMDDRHIDIVHFAADRATNVVMAVGGGIEALLGAPDFDLEDHAVLGHQFQIAIDRAQSYAG